MVGATEDRIAEDNLPRRRDLPVERRQVIQNIRTQPQQSRSRAVLNHRGPVGSRRKPDSPRDHVMATSGATRPKWSRKAEFIYSVLYAEYYQMVFSIL